MPEEIRAVRDDEWPIVARLWQAFREDLAPIVQGFPYADGRYQAGTIDPAPTPDLEALMTWREHPRAGGPAPIAFAVVDGLTREARSMAGFWVAPAARRGGTGRRLAVATVARHTGPWRIGFQHENPAAGRFWRGVADEVFGPGAWVETRQPVVTATFPVPDDHVISSRSRAPRSG